MDGDPIDEQALALFETPGQPSPGGGITAVNPDEFTPSNKQGGVMLYLYVNGLEGWEEVSP